MGDEKDFDWDRGRPAQQRQEARDAARAEREGAREEARVQRNTARAEARAQRDEARKAARAERDASRQTRKLESHRRYVDRHADKATRWRERELIRSQQEAARLARWDDADRFGKELQTLREQRHRGRKGRKLTGPIAGAILMVIGLGWLINEMGYLRLPWNSLFSLVLITLGVGLIVGAQRARHGGLIFVGLLLILLLIGMSSITLPVPNFPVEGGVGERVVRPTALPDFSNYGLGVGSLTVDLTSTPLTPGQKQINARVGIGELLVVVPEDVALQVNSRAGTGNLEIFGRSVARGSSVQNVFTSENFEGAETRVSLTLSVGMGEVRVISGLNRPV